MTSVALQSSEAQTLLRHKYARVAPPPSTLTSPPPPDTPLTTTMFFKLPFSATLFFTLAFAALASADVHRRQNRTYYFARSSTPAMLTSIQWAA